MYKSNLYGRIFNLLEAISGMICLSCAGSFLYG